MRTLSIALIILLISIAWALVKGAPEDGRTMLADVETDLGNGTSTVIRNDGTVATCIRVGSGGTAVLICN